MTNGHSLPNGVEKNGVNGLHHKMEDKEGKKENTDKKDDDDEKKDDLAPTVGLIELVSSILNLPSEIQKKLLTLNSWWGGVNLTPPPVVFFT